MAGLEPASFLWVTTSLAQRYIPPLQHCVLPLPTAFPSFRIYSFAFHLVSHGLHGRIVAGCVSL